ALRGVPDALQRGAQVAVDVVRQRLQRRHVQHAAALVVGHGRLGVEAVDRPTGSGEGLAGAGRGVDERVSARADRRPAFGLGFGRRVERRPEPRRGRRGELLEYLHRLETTAAVRQLRGAEVRWSTRRTRWGGDATGVAPALVELSRARPPQLARVPPDGPCAHGRAGGRTARSARADAAGGAATPEHGATRSCPSTAPVRDAGAEGLCAHPPTGGGPTPMPTLTHPRAPAR